VLAVDVYYNIDVSYLLSCQAAYLYFILVGMGIA